MHTQRRSSPPEACKNGAGRPDRKPVIGARRLLKAGILAALLGAVPAMSALAAPPQASSLTEPASPDHHVGKIIFLELVTPDMAVSKQFYGNLFGWTFRDSQSGNTEYSEAFVDGRLVAGLIHKNMPQGDRHQPAWLSFISVRDVEAAKNTALKQGAKVLREPHDIPNRGREAVFADPQGAVFAVLASSSGDPADFLSAPGEWIWSSLITTDPDADAAFYQSLFGYEVFELPGDGVGNTQHLMLATDDYARASANSLPAVRPGMHPHWLNYVRVEDTVQAAQKLVALGGHVLVEPRVDRHGGKIAVVADPSGAPFGLIEWPNSESKQVSK